MLLLRTKLALITMTAHLLPSILNVSPGANVVRSNSVWMNGAPVGGMDVGDSMMGPGKASGLPMGAACSTCGIWKTDTRYCY